MTAPPRHLLARAVDESLLEDVGPGDITTSSTIPEGLRCRCEIRTRADIVVAGLDAAIMVFLRLDPDTTVVTAAADGDRIPSGGLLLSLDGSARALLTGERAALNFLAHLSGIATMTAAFVRLAGGKAVIAETRKTTPGLRLLEKYAVTAGGGTNHRAGLWDAILIKDNHVDLAGGIAAAVSAARDATSARVQIEVRNLDELDQALAAGAEAVLLDNFTGEALGDAVRRAKGMAFIEVSGGVTLETVGAIAALGVDRISIGALTHSAPGADLTMRISRMTK